MHYLLIHGSWYGAWCWHKIVPRLESEGHRVTAVNLPGRGRDPATMQLVGLGRLVKAAMACLPENEATTVVVHSRYGVLASALAEAAPDRIARTIYLASFMLPNGKAVADYFRSDANSWLPLHVTISKIGMLDQLDPKAYRECLYHDCGDDDNALSASLLSREPLRPAIAKIKLTDEKYGRIPRSYIRLTEDRAVSVSMQDRLINETGADRVETIEAGHSAYFSQPDKLTQTILKLSTK